MKTDSLKKYVKLRDALLKHKAELEAQLSEIKAALGSETPAAASTPASASAPVVTRARRGRKPRVVAPVAVAKENEIKSGRGGKRMRNGLSLRRAIIQVTSDGPLTKEQILGAVKKIGYKFGASNPLPSLNAVLYAKPKFTNDDGKFGPPA